MATDANILTLQPIEFNSQKNNSKKKYIKRKYYLLLSLSLSLNSVRSRSVITPFELISEVSHPYGSSLPPLVRIARAETRSDPTRPVRLILRSFLFGELISPLAVERCVITSLVAIATWRHGTSVNRGFITLSFSKMVSFEMNDMKKIGLGLTGFGVFFSFLGIIFFFDKGFLAMGNILFISGLMMTIGLKSTMQFFMKPKNYKGTISFGLGFLLVLIGWPVFGMILESYGFIVLFSGFWPTLAVFLQRIPVFGWIIQQPFVTSLVTRYRGRRVPV
ncbi:Got1/Sft2-like vescicle transport protein family [Rhynchospora pubera]|uniref:Got1/Sft2-like vescicle transport protein family n=3 Tax=Rhynchospora pubera TaxID=906938 RepID=A0AAV8CK50_9POAL|nr:Got1/Sft2-like vescicle transport protein family [Rhynchospora pubera]